MAGPPTKAEIRTFQDGLFAQVFTQLNRRDVGTPASVEGTLKKGGANLRFRCDGIVIRAGASKQGYTDYEQTGRSGIVVGRITELN